MTTDGGQISSFEPNDKNLRDLAWDGFHIWMINSEGTIKKFTTDGVLIDSIVGLLTGGWGLTYGNDCLWASDPDKDTVYQISLPVGVEDKNIASLTDPLTFRLSQNYPNPFNPIKIINYTLPRDTYVRLEIYNPLGQNITTLINERQTAGYKTIHWNTSSVANGIYFCRIQAGDYTETKRIMLLK